MIIAALACRTLVAVALLAVGWPQRDAGAQTVSRRKVGDTAIVRTVSGSVWGDAVRLERELRVGAADGDENYLFAGINYLAVAPNGSMYVFDRSYGLRLYDANGRFVRAIGRRGQGPGEYSDAAGLAVLPSGDVAVWDPGNGRIVRFAADGTPRGVTSVASTLFTGQAFVVAASGEQYVKTMLIPPNENRSMVNGYIHLDRAGKIVDTIRNPPLPIPIEKNTQQVDPRSLWTVSPLGYVVGGSNDRYAFSIFRRDGVLRIERDVERPAWSDGERKQRQDAYDEGARTRGTMPYTVPPRKPMYRSITPMDDGRIWVRLHATGIPGPPATAGGPPRWIEPTIYDVFRDDGTYLGQVRLPDRSELHLVRGDQLWLVERGADDEPYIGRYRMRVPSTR